MVKKLTLNFSYQFEGIVWNILTDKQGTHIAIEVRDPAFHKTRFSAINLQTGKSLFLNKEFEEKWWVGMTDFEPESILFHVYQDAQSLQPTGYFLYRDNGKSIVWECSECTFVKRIDNKYLFHKGEEGIQLLVDSASGEEKTLKEEDISGILLQEPENNKFSYPFHYSEGSEYFKTVQSYLLKYHSIEPEGAMDYLELKNSIIVSYYICTRKPDSDSKVFDNLILVLDKNGNIKHQEKIDEKLSGIGLATFFVVDDQLIFTKNKKEIISYYID